MNLRRIYDPCPACGRFELHHLNERCPPKEREYAGIVWRCLMIRSPPPACWTRLALPTRLQALAAFFFA